MVINTMFVINIAYIEQYLMDIHGYGSKYVRSKYFKTHVP